MHAKGETNQPATSRSILDTYVSPALSAPVRSRSSIIAAQLKTRPVAAPTAPAAPSVTDSVSTPVCAAASTKPIKPRMTLEELQARAAMSASAAAAVSEQMAEDVGSPAEMACGIAELGGLSEGDILRLLNEYEQCKLQAKALYARKDQIEAQLLKVLKAGDQVTLIDGRIASIVDNFAQRDKKTGEVRNAVWAPACVRRFEIEITGTSR